MQQQAADRIGGAPAIVEQLGEIGVAVLRDVLSECVEQVLEQLDRKSVPPDEACQLRGRFELRSIAPQFLEANLHSVVAFVGDVVGAARKAVDGADRLAQRRRQQKRCDWGDPGMAGRHARGSYVAFMPFFGSLTSSEGG